ncbi:MAG: hypothetical protein ACFFDN_36175, partial [Candidatus Hodarchaeota archaeon]
MKRQKKFFIFVYIIILISFILLPFIDFERSNIINNLDLKNAQKNKDSIFTTESTNSINPLGTGALLKGEEYPYNESNKQDLTNGTSFNWNIPNNYSGKKIWIKIDNLTANQTGNTPQEIADSAIVNQGEEESGTDYTDTNSSGGGYYQVNDGPGGNAIDFDLRFDIDEFSKQDITRIDWYVRGRKAPGGVNIGIYMFNDTDSTDIFLNNVTYDLIFGWGIYSGTIFGNDCFNDANNRVTLSFIAENDNGNYIQLDHVLIMVYYDANFKSVYPETIGFRVQHDSTPYIISSASNNATSIEGNWIGPTTETFTFLSNDPSNFDLEYIRFLNNSKDATTYYYLADNENVKNTWKVNFTAGPIPTGYDKLNFTVELPNDWEYLNTTAPNGSNNTAQTTAIIVGNKLFVSVSSIAVDPFKSQLPLNWSIYANSSNYISTVQFFQYPDFITPMLSPIIYNLTDNMTIKCPLNTPTNSPLSANLTIFNSTDYVMHQE